MNGHKYAHQHTVKNHQKDGGHRRQHAGCHRQQANFEVVLKQERSEEKLLSTAVITPRPQHRQQLFRRRTRLSLICSRPQCVSHKRVGRSRKESDQSANDHQHSRNQMQPPVSHDDAAKSFHQKRHGSTPDRMTRWQIDQTVSCRGQPVQVSDQVLIPSLSCDARQMHGRPTIQLVQTLTFLWRKATNGFPTALDQARQFIPFVLVTTYETAHTLLPPTTPLSVSVKV